ncbi:MAG: hypothetical protein JO235_07680 [Chroococcidiopsidaceae cyanobacterium CP_BM_RX_35]|nr:hypothetical protein [Chroococcidiopsidaceae cyanobacterium CP_BM_RX_35]
MVAISCSQQQDTFHFQGEPYYIKGAGTGDLTKLEILAASGGNSLRTWGVNDKTSELLDKAHALKLTVTLGLWLGQERQGFDYSNPTQVAQQLADIKSQVLRYKDHPALLMWGLGNELDLYYSNPLVWDALEQLVQAIHTLDGKHPVMTAIAGPNIDTIHQLQRRVPSLDILGINQYGGLGQVSQQLQAANWRKPYVITEWGAQDSFQADKTQWGAPIELSSSNKASLYADNYQKIQEAYPQCIGSYVFFWGSKYETTPTWFSMFAEEGRKTPMVDVMHYFWKGSLPKDQAPKINSLVTIDGQSQYESTGQGFGLYLSPKHNYTAQIGASDPDSDQLTYRWELRRVSTAKHVGGDNEPIPPIISSALSNSAEDKIQMTTPTEAGAYRLFVYVLDGRNGVGTANATFYVTSQ